MTPEDSPFLSRWSRRKTLVREGLAVEAEAPAGVDTKPMPVPQTTPGAAAVAAGAAPLDTAVVSEAPPALTLDDVASLTRESDFSAFMAQGVTPEVKNAALKKLFTVPHFNVMDGLDTYIDDYGKPDPLPESWLRQMVQSQMLGLFADDPPTAVPTESPDAPHALHAAPPPATPLPKPADEDADLQLQPDDAARCVGAEPGPGEDAGREH